MRIIVAATLLLSAAFAGRGSGEMSSAAKDTRTAVYNFTQFSSASFPEAETAWLVTAPEGKLLHTSDGGATWETVRAGASNRVAAVSFVNARQGFVVDEEAARLWRTDDGGRTWVEASRLKKRDISDFLGISQLTFADGLRGWISDSFRIWRTEDGGATWLPAEFVPDLEDEYLQCEWFLDEKRGWAGASGGRVYRTGDGGKTWRLLAKVGRLEIDEIFFLNPRDGWLITSNARLYRTRNGGRSWRQILTPRENVLLRSVFFSSEKEGWLAGQKYPPSRGAKEMKGLLLRTTDGGSTWTRVSAGDDEAFYERVVFVDSERGWLIGRDSVYRTGDGGRTWKRVYSLPPREG